MDVTASLALPPPVPSKYDIIPIHTSDVAAFLSCRRRWNWTSPARNNLRRSVQINGVNTNLWFGSGIHYALEMFYHPLLKRDPIEAFETWFKYQWEGGIVTEDWLERLYDNNPIELTDDDRHKAGHGDTSLYKVKGLWDLLPDPDQHEFQELRTLGVEMLKFYKEYAAKNDDFLVVAPEMTFSVPLINPETGKIMYAIDTREQSPNYGKKLEVHARGKRDAIIYKPAIDRYQIIDYKTAAVVNEDYFVKLTTDPQCSTYIWASQEEAKMHDLPYKKIDEVIYCVLRKAFPKPPTELKNGTPSLNRADESTTAEMFSEFIKENALEIWYESNDKAQAYYNYLLASGDTQFIVREPVPRNEHMIANTGRNIAEIAMDMLAENLRIYPHFTGDYNCTRCAFRSPCIALEDGSDAQFLIDNGYERNRDR